MEQNNYDKWIKDVRNKLYNKKIQLNVMQALPYWVASLLTGLTAVLYTKLFALSETVSLTIVHTHGWLLFILTPVCFVLAWWLVKKYDKKAGGSGIPQVMAAIELANPKYNHLVDQFLSIRTIIIKVLSSLLMVLGGGAIGREGPTVQIAGSIFRKVNQLLPKSWPKISKKNMIMTGAAAGLAAAFNTPLGGIVFAVEELAKTHISYFKTPLFTAVIIAGLTAQSFLGSYLYLGYPDIKNISGFIFFFVLLVGAISGVAGGLMGKIIFRILVWKKTIAGKPYELLYIIGCALLIATIAYVGHYGILGSGKAQIARMLFTTDKHVKWTLPIIRILGPVASFTTGASGGIFAPSLGAGATIGGLIAGWIHVAPSDENILILSGMAAFLTGITRSPFTSAILVLEMTNGHNIIFHLMLASIISSLFAIIVDKHSFYEHLKNQYVLDVVREESAMIPEPEDPTKPLLQP